MVVSVQDPLFDNLWTSEVYEFCHNFVHLQRNMISLGFKWLNPDIINYLHPDTSKDVRNLGKTMQPRLEVKLSVNYIYLKLQLHSKGLTKAVEGTDYQRFWAEAEMFAKTNHLFLAPLATTTSTWRIIPGLVCG